VFLTEEQIQELTGKKQHGAQARALSALGLKYGKRPDGSLVVLHDAVDSLLNNGPRRKITAPEPNWGALT